MDVSIIIITYNEAHLTSECIRSVIEYTKGIKYEIILVDNASTKYDPQQFLMEFPGIKLVKSPVNGGFARGNNLGMANTTGEYILLLNNDTILKENSIAKCLDHLKKSVGTGVVSCRMKYPDNTVQYTARKFKSISWELLDLFRFIPTLMPYKKRSRLMLGKYFRHAENVECDWVIGAFFMFPREILNQLPGKKLDDRFFMYGEDQLWCEQIKKLGYRIIFYAGTTIIHISSGSTELKKQLALRKLIMKNELEIMRLRKGKGMYYFLFAIIYGIKERARNFLKLIVLKSGGRLIR